MRCGVKRMLALLLAVVFTAGISGVGALMEVSTVYEGTVLAADSGSSGPDDTTSSGDAATSSSEAATSSESAAPPASSSEAAVDEVLGEAAALPPPNMTQQQVNQYVNMLLMRLYGYQTDPAGNAENIWQAARELAALPYSMARRAPDYDRVYTLLDVLAALTGRAQASVEASARAQALGIVPGTVAHTGLTVLSGLSGGVPAVLYIDVKDAPTHGLPSDVSGYSMVVLELRFTAGGAAVSPPLPVQLDLPLPAGAQRSRAVLLCYENGAATPRRITPSLHFESPAWRMGFTAMGRGEFVLANIPVPSDSTKERAREDQRLYDYWLDVIARIESAGENGVVHTYTKSAGLRNVPVTVLDALYGRDVTLYIDFGADNEIIIYGATMDPIPSGKVFYPYWDLYKLYSNADGTPASRVVSRVPTEGDPADVIDVPRQYVGTVVPANAGGYAQPAGGQSSAQRQESVARPAYAPDATMAEPEVVASRAESLSATEPETEQMAVQTASAPRKVPGSITIPIWAPALVAGGVLLGLAAGVLAAGARRGPRGRDDNAAPR